MPVVIVLFPRKSRYFFIDSTSELEGPSPSDGWHNASVDVVPRELVDEIEPINNLKLFRLFIFRICHFYIGFEAVK